MTRTHSLALAIYFAMGSMAHATETATPTGEVISSAADAVRISGADLKAFGWTQSESSSSPETASPGASTDTASQTKPLTTEGIADIPVPDPTDGRSSSLTAPQTESEPSTPNVAESSVNPVASESQALSATSNEQITETVPVQSSPQSVDPAQTPTATTTTPVPSTESASAATETPATTSGAAIEVTPSLAGTTTATPNAATPLPPNSTVTENSGP